MCTHACVFVDAGVTLAFTKANGRAHYHHNNPNSTVNTWSAGAMIALFNILAGAEKNQQSSFLTEQTTLLTTLCVSQGNNSYMAVCIALLRSCQQPVVAYTVCEILIFYFYLTVLAFTDNQTFHLVAAHEY